MARALKVCSTPGCPELVASGRCATCSADADRARGTAAARGYGRRWSRHRRPAYLARNPICCLCGALATIPDHWPVDRRTLVLQGVADPDADEHLRPLCGGCHRTETAVNQPGGWAAR